MAPQRAREPSIDRSGEYEKFIRELEQYHEKRGTVFDPEPKVANRHLDLLRLYKRVMEEGGYDKVSDIKNNKLAWRKIAQEFLPNSSNIATQAFMVKTAYYKNLAAYEISTHHKREPPPKEILEHVSAKGGDLLNRTLDNFQRPVNRETGNLANGLDNKDESDGSDDDAERTPKEDKMDMDEPTSTGRVTRALRQAPPQRVLFQPEVSAPRQTRHSSGMANHTSSTSHSGHHNSASTNGAVNRPDNSSIVIANYEPSQLAPIRVNPLFTPKSNPEMFARKQSKARDQMQRGLLKPGTGYVGPSIYVRTLMAMKSGILDEQRYALYHLVRISNERFDKFRMEQFPGLGTALIQKVLEIAPFFSEVQWTLSYLDNDDVMADPQTLNGISSTPNLLDKIRSHKPKKTVGELLTPDERDRLQMINEAGLVLRNMLLHEDNARYAAVSEPLFRDMITIILNLPKSPHVVELRLYALEMAEQLVRYFVLDSSNPLYLSLISQLDSNDRGVIIQTLRSLSRISELLPDIPNRLQGISPRALERIHDYLLVDDEELRTAVLEFWCYYTNMRDNVGDLVKSVNIASFIQDLRRFLLHGAILEKQTRQPSKTAMSAAQAHSGGAAPWKAPDATTPLVCPPSILKKIARMGKDPAIQAGYWYVLIIKFASGC
ncbi:hypothetical protein BDY21DRAFT_357932 [Lineolata rhizophorae]|uniref:ARID domain-containing protein n=1 Tax=Lineolata rhizophorae TaxID=578093 RepID=A0A6A6NM91_9PEZI|nr:hypothetical protein BDY21DRAFT_357932 [Lineolata rhizophorae]